MMGMGYKLMSRRMEVAVDEGMSGEEVLRLFGRFEPLHLPLSSARRPMRVPGPIVQVSLCRCSTPGSSWTASDTIASQACRSRSPAGGIANPSEASEEALRGVGIAPGLNEDVKHNTILIDGAPEVVLHALDPDEDLNSRQISCPSVALSRRRRECRAQPGAHPSG
jgi:hypothetical protein